MLSPREMIVIPVFWIRILSTLLRTTFICNRILPRSLRARLTECQWENWIWKARRASQVRQNRHRLLPKTIGIVHVEIGRESPRIPEDCLVTQRRLGHAGNRGCDPFCCRGADLHRFTMVLFVVLGVFAVSRFHAKPVVAECRWVSRKFGQQRSLPPNIYTKCPSADRTDQLPDGQLGSSQKRRSRR